MDLERKHLIILGCGYLGTALALKAHSAGMKVTALTRSQSRADILREIGIHRVVLADIQESGWVNEL